MIFLLQLCASKKSETEWGSCRINTQGSSLALEIRNTSTTKTWVKLNQRYILVVEFMYLVFTCMPSETENDHARRRFRSLLYLCYVFRTLINSLVCWFCSSSFCTMWPEAQGQGCQVLKEVNIIYIYTFCILSTTTSTKRNLPGR